MIADGGGIPPQLVPRLEALLGFWQRRYGTRPIPERPLFEAAELDPWARHAAWIDLVPGGRYRIRVFGVDLIRRFGREATGHHVDTLALDIALDLRQKLGRASATAAPVPGVASVQLGREAAKFSELVLPLAGAGAGIGQFLLASYELRQEPLR